MASISDLIGRAIRKLQAKPGLIRGYQWDHPDTLNVSGINAAAAALGIGPIFKVGESPPWWSWPNLPTDHPDNQMKVDCLTVLHPDGTEFGIRRHNGELDDSSTFPTTETIARLEVWQSQATLLEVTANQMLSASLQNDFTMTAGAACPPESVVNAAIDAHATGYQIIAGWLNDQIAACAAGTATALPSDTKLRIDADPPPPNVTLRQCQNSFANTLLGILPFAPDFDRDDRKVYPWTIGFLGKSDLNELVLIRVPAAPEQLGDWESDIERRVGVWAFDWSEDEWRRNVKEPVESYFQEWAEWLRSMLPLPNIKPQQLDMRPSGYPNYDRDKLIYESRRAGKTWKEIAILLKQQPQWDALTEAGYTQRGEDFCNTMWLRQSFRVANLADP